MKDDEKLLKLFLSRDPSAVRETDKLYGAYCRKVAGNILSDKRDVEECVNDALLKAWDSIPPNEPERLGAYLAALARNGALNMNASRNQGKRWNGKPEKSISELGEIVSNTGDPYSELRSKELTSAITDFLKNQTKEKQRMFMARYWYYEETAEIARKMGKTANNVYVQLSKLRMELKKYLIERGFEL